MDWSDFSTKGVTGNWKTRREETMKHNTILSIVDTVVEIVEGLFHIARHFSNSVDQGFHPIVDRIGVECMDASETW